MAASIRVEPDAAGNIKFAKHRARGKIDGAVAVAMGIGRRCKRGRAVGLRDGTT
ncbi:MAG: hypothetical protein AB7P12_08095 [Alphaproteobacteria bacterium]